MRRRGLLKLVLGAVATAVAAPVKRLLPASAPTAWAPYIYAPYFPMYGEPEIPEMTMIAVNSPITAKCVKLKASWALEDGYTLEAFHGEECESDAHTA